jgi:hypothetical protein
MGVQSRGADSLGSGEGPNAHPGPLLAPPSPPRSRLTTQQPLPAAPPPRRGRPATTPAATPAAASPVLASAPPGSPASPRSPTRPVPRQPAARALAPAAPTPPPPPPPLALADDGGSGGGRLRKRAAPPCGPVPLPELARRAKRHRCGGLFAGVSFMVTGFAEPGAAAAGGEGEAGGGGEGRLSRREVCGAASGLPCRAVSFRPSRLGLRVLRAVCSQAVDGTSSCQLCCRLSLSPRHARWST